MLVAALIPVYARRRAGLAADDPARGRRAAALVGFVGLAAARVAGADARRRARARLRPAPGAAAQRGARGRRLRACSGLVLCYQMAIEADVVRRRRHGVVTGPAGVRQPARPARPAARLRRLAQRRLPPVPDRRRGRRRGCSRASWPGRSRSARSRCCARRSWAALDLRRRVAASRMSYVTQPRLAVGGRQGDDDRLARDHVRRRARRRVRAPARAALARVGHRRAARRRGRCGRTRYQYHDVSLAPRDRMEELEQIGDEIAGEGPTLYTEFEEFGKHFLREAAPEGSSEGWQRRFAEAEGRDGRVPALRLRQRHRPVHGRLPPLLPDDRAAARLLRQPAAVDLRARSTRARTTTSGSGRPTPPTR